MARRRQRGERGKPWYRRDRDAWFITQGKKKVALCDKHGNYVHGVGNRAEALRVWHEMMALADAPQRGDENEVRLVLELYLQDLENRAAPKTVGDYAGFFRDFLQRWPGLLVRDLKPAHVRTWWEGHPTWRNTYRNLTGTALKAALNWAAKPGKGGGIIPANPLDGMTLPTGRKRSATVVIEPHEFDRLMGLVKSQAVRDILTVLWHTGTRPGNLAIATADNLTADGKALIFGEHNTPPESSTHKTYKKTGRALIVPLPDAARDVCLRLRVNRPCGPLFRTSRGRPWNRYRIANTVRHYAKRAGLEGRFMAYSCRHSRTTTLLENGESDSVVAAIMGNSPQAIHRNYSHVYALVERLREVANRHAPATAP
jgi:integrase